MEKSNLSRAAQHHLIMAMIESEKDGSQTEADKASEDQEAETENQSAECMELAIEAWNLTNRGIAEEKGEIIGV